jgi:hypothetical protein
VKDTALLVIIGIPAVERLDLSHAQEPEYMLAALCSYLNGLTPNALGLGVGSAGLAPVAQLPLTSTSRIDEP